MVIDKVIKELIRSKYPTDSPLGFGDDASAIKLREDLYILIKIDGSSLRSSKYPWISWSDLGYRITLSSATDILCKGGTVHSFLISIGLPRDYDVNIIYELLLGIRDLANELGAYILGGDTNCSEADGWLDITSIGFTDRPIPNTFKPNDELYLSGCLGLSSILAITYYKRVPYDDVKDIIKKAIRPKPPLNVLSIRGIIKASTDISDGLSSIRRVLKYHNLDLVINDELPLCREVLEFMEATGITTDDVLKYLGEEYLIAFSVIHESSIKGKYPLLGKLRRGSGNIIFRGKVLHYGWDNFRGYLVT